VAWLLLLGASATFVALVAVLTPWHPLPGASITPAAIHAYFTPAQIARSDAFFSSARWPSWLGLLLGLVAAAAVGFTRLGRQLVGLVRHRVRRWWLQVLCLVGLVVLISRLAVLPTDVWAQHVARSYGLSNQSWPSWLLDEAKSLVIAFVVSALLLLLLVGLARRFSRTWFLPAAAGAGVLVFVASFAYPVVIEPAFNSFTSLPDGRLRTALLHLAAADHVTVSDVLVADASRRTTALNAYVSGFGSTRRIVLYDTVLRSTPEKQIVLIVAHELGHAKRDDVLVGTLEGAVAAVMAVAALFIVLRPELVRRPTGAGSMRDPAIVPVVMSLAAFASVAALPVQNAISRHVEARADAHSLDLTSDPGDFIKMQRRLAVTNLSHLDPNPVLSDIFNSHPPPLDRIGMALAWERLHHGP
jgi:Zn-dependent protease with chaperone function